MLDYQVFNVKATPPRSKEVDSLLLNLISKHSNWTIGFNWWWLPSSVKSLEYPQKYQHSGSIWS